MSKSGKPPWVAKKYMGDCPNSWAIIDKRYLPKGHRGVVMEWLPQCAVSYSGLNRHNKAYYLRMKKEEAKAQSK